MEAWTDGDGLGGAVAVRGRGPGREPWRGSPRGENLARFLGWFSLGLGAAELLAPGMVGRLIGVRPGPRGRTLVRAMGLREIGAGLGLLANPRSKEWMGARVAGDAIDLALLGAALTRSSSPCRTLLATGAVMGVTALDVIGAEQLSRSRRVPSPELLEARGAYVRKTITIACSRSDAYRLWRDFSQLPRFMQHLDSVDEIGDRLSRWRARGPGGKAVEWDAELLADRADERIAWRSLGGADVYNAGTVTFADAPAERGTEVTVEVWYAPPGGPLASTLLKLIRREPRQQVSDDLRRFKQILETGEVVLSDASAARGPHAAQPSAAGMEAA
jgi:uncharacterized membrane protein